MKIVSISYNYSEFSNYNDWSVENLQLKDLNLLVGKNATGKSRILQLISSFSKMIAQKTTTLFFGNWNMVFQTKSGGTLSYILNIKDSKTIKELIKVDNMTLLDRNGETTIYSYKSSSCIEINPPDNKLVLHVRRDKEEYPYLEEIVEWAEQTHGFKFGNITPYSYLINKENDRLTSVDSIPALLESVLELEGIGEKDFHLNNILNDFNSLGYDIENIKIGKDDEKNIFMVKENYLEKYIPQNSLSQGMFRSLALIVFIEYLVTTKKVSTVLIDDLCEGLDYERASKLGNLLFKKYAKQNIQLIVTSNDSFLMDSIDIENWNVLIRKGNTVRALNYENSTELFNKFKYTGLSNFDLFSSDYLTE